MASKIPSNSLLVVCINIIVIFSLINLIIALDMLHFFAHFFQIVSYAIQVYDFLWAANSSRADPQSIEYVPFYPNILYR